MPGHAHYPEDRSLRILWNKLELAVVDDDKIMISVEASLLFLSQTGKPRGWSMVTVIIILMSMRMNTTRVYVCVVRSEN